MKKWVIEAQFPTRKKNQKKETIRKRWCGQKITPHPLRVTISGDRGVKSIFHLFLSLNYFSLFTFNLFFLFSGNDTKRKKSELPRTIFTFLFPFPWFPAIFFSGKWKVSHERKGRKEIRRGQSEDDTVAHFSIVGSVLYHEWKKRKLKRLSQQKQRAIESSLLCAKATTVIQTF